MAGRSGGGSGENNIEFPVRRRWGWGLGRGFSGRMAGAGRTECGFTIGRGRGRGGWGAGTGVGRSARTRWLWDFSVVIAIYSNDCELNQKLTGLHNWGASLDRHRCLQWHGKRHCHRRSHISLLTLLGRWSWCHWILRGILRNSGQVFMFRRLIVSLSLAPWIGRVIIHLHIVYEHRHPTAPVLSWGLDSGWCWCHWRLRGNSYFIELGSSLSSSWYIWHSNIASVRLGIPIFWTER